MYKDQVSDIKSISRLWVVVCFSIVLVLALSFAVWYWVLQGDTAMQPLVRNNSNHQSGTMIANNSYLHTLLATIETDKQGVIQFDNNMSTFCQLHNTSRIGAGCKSTGAITSYDDQQTYQQYQDNITAAQTSLSDDINQYNQYWANRDIVGVDGTLPRHINADGSYRDTDGSWKKGT